MSNETTFDPAEFCEAQGIPLTDLERYPLDGCARTRRDGSVDYPYQGCSVWLLPDTPMSLTSAGMDFRLADKNADAGREGFKKLNDGLAQVVAGHDVPGISQWHGDPEAVSVAPAWLLMYVFKIVQIGEVPENHPNASGGGPTGASIRRRTGKMTPR